MQLCWLLEYFSLSFINITCTTLFLPQAGSFCPNSVTRTLCPIGSISAARAISCTACAAGKYAGSGTTGSTMCNDCSGSTYSTAGQGACTFTQSTCPAGTYSESPNSCLNCGANLYSIAGSTSVSGCSLTKWSCPAGTFSTGTNACQICPSGQYSRFGSVGGCAGNCPGTVYSLLLNILQPLMFSNIEYKAGFFLKSGTRECQPWWE